MFVLFMEGFFLLLGRSLKNHQKKPEYLLALLADERRLLFGGCEGAEPPRGALRAPLQRAVVHRCQCIGEFISMFERRIFPPMANIFAKWPYTPEGTGSAWRFYA